MEYLQCAGHCLWLWGRNSERDKVLFLMEFTFYFFVKFKYDNIIELLAYSKCPVNDGYCNYTFLLKCC